MKYVLEAAGVDVPYMFDPRPNSYIKELKDNFKDLDYSKASHTLKIEDAPPSLAFSSLISQAASA